MCCVDPFSSFRKGLRWPHNLGSKSGEGEACQGSGPKPSPASRREYLSHLWQEYSKMSWNTESGWSQEISSTRHPGLTLHRAQQRRLHTRLNRTTLTVSSGQHTTLAVFDAAHRDAEVPLRLSRVEQSLCLGIQHAKK